MRRTLIAALAVATLAACGGGGSDQSSSTAERPTTTERATTTTDAPTPEEAFLDDMATELEFGEADGPETMLALAQATCDALDAIDDMAGADAPNDNASTDAAIGATSETVAIAAAFGGDLDDRVVAVVLTNGGEHLCPQHAGAIEDYIEREGIESP